jgi:cytochrome P450
MSAALHELPPKFDASDPSVRENPYPTYARLRTAGRLCRGGPGQWVVTQYDDVAALLGDSRLQNKFPVDYHQLSAGTGPSSEFLERIMLHQDGPEHRRWRRMLMQYFDGAALRSLRARITELVDDLLAPASESGLLEAVEELALPLPAMVMFEILGVPLDHRKEIHFKVLEMGRAFSLTVTPENRAIANEAVTWLRRYTLEVLKLRQQKPGDDLISQMLTGDETPGRNIEEAVDNIVFLFFAGFETTSSVISTGCAALMNHAEQFRKLREDHSLVPRAVEEFMRYDAPIQSRLRYVQQPIEIDGRTIRPGRLLLLLLGSANHDEKQFHRPEELDVTRYPNPHLSFGGGHHYCLGAGLARLEAGIVFAQLVRRFRSLAPASPASRNLEGPFRSYDRIPMAVRPTLQK